MEGWLQVPPERNLMGRAAWKVRYVVFGRDTSNSRAYLTSPARPTSAVDRHSYSHSPSESVSTVTNDVRNTFFLTIYKHKNDLEPISRHSIQDIASCYVGDLGIKQKKQLILPTLIIHLKPEQQVSSPRSFRRRSNDNPYATKSAPTALLFRPGPENPDSLQRWAKEIQTYLNMCANPQRNSNDRNPTSPIDDRFPDTPHTSSSLFFVNGEPNTALLSPSLRSKCSDLSSIPSDRRSISSSSLSELPSPRVDDHAQEFHGRKTLHISTNSADFDSHVLEDRASTSKEQKDQPRRETILDRYFSCYPSPVTSTPDRPLSSSIARFEALMDELESKNPGGGRNGRAESLASLSERSASLQELEMPVRIPTPTLRALEFVSTGVYHPDDIPEAAESAESSPRNSLVILNDNRRLSVGMYSNLSRRNSDSSIGGASSIAGAPSSVVGSLSGGFASEKGQSSYISASSKRHSISDFGARNVNGSGYYSTTISGISRPGSISEFTHDFSDEATLQKLGMAHNFHSRNNRPPPPVLMHDFLF